MEEEYCVFLRGINVNGIKIKMDALKKAFQRMGFTNVKTILATGNVIVSTQESNSDRKALKLFIEKELDEYFGYDAHVILRSKNDVHGLCTAAQTMIVPEAYHQYCLLCDDRELSSELKRLFDRLPHTLDESLQVTEYDAFWNVPIGFTLNSDFGSKVLGDKKYKNRLTSRNMNTIRKIDQFLFVQA